jgi:hypothetical protein
MQQVRLQKFIVVSGTRKKKIVIEQCMGGVVSISHEYNNKEFEREIMDGKLQIL